jgi:MSHA biogenesis protein MshL
VQDGNIVAIGGLMRQESMTANSQVPGIGNVPGIGALFQQRNRQITKSEVVILLKPTIVHSDRNWQQDLTETRERIRALEPKAQQQPQ